ncbi:MAG TPA: hypothetical protein VMV86_06745 [Methanosarcinales archaeon]|nr:hypothetical protein [Methanosarcinales archaeon]
MTKKEIKKLLNGTFPDNEESIIQYCSFFNDKDDTKLSEAEHIDDFMEFLDK